MYDLARMHVLGRGVDQSDEEAAKWCKLLLVVRRRRRRGCCLLPVYCLPPASFFSSAPFSPFLAHSCAKRSSFLNRPHGCGARSRERAVQPRGATHHGPRVEKSDEEAVKWFGAAAAQGDVQAQEQLERIEANMKSGKGKNKKK